jgi:hypothetical protein
MTEQTNADNCEFDFDVAIAENVSSSPHNDGDSVVIESAWGDKCYVSSWHLVREKELYFVKKAIREGKLTVG